MTGQIRKSIPRVLLLLCMISCFLASMIQAYAVPACPFPVKFKQPDGSSFTAYIKGDEYQAWTETASGYSVVKNAKLNRWEYATKNYDGRLVPSGKFVSPKTAAPSWIKRHLAPERIVPDDSGGRTPFSSSARRAGSYSNWPARQVRGTGKLLVIMVNFEDRACSTTPYSWNNTIFNTNPGEKSVANFYADNSFGNFGITPVNHTQADAPAGIISVTLAQKHPNYGGNFDYETEIAWINEALAEAAGVVDFAALDTNHDLTLETNEAIVYFIVAGYEASGTGNSPSIWAHAWGGPGVSAGGIQVTDWAMNGELNDASAQHPIGAITHELGHSMCGLPDLYDTTYFNSGLGVFSLMSYGSWGKTAYEPFAGSTPVSLDAWSRQYLGWSAPKVPTDLGLLYFYPALDSESSTIKLVNDRVSSSEYFLVENRYPEGWDMGLEGYLGPNWGGGLLTLHIDESIGYPSNNDINAYVPGSHQGVMAEEASTRYGSMVQGTSEGDVTHMFYKENKAKFDGSGTPNSKLYDGTATNLGLQNISSRKKVMTANLAVSTVATPVFYPDSGKYDTEVNVVISCATPGAVIHYTTNGNAPTEDDPVINSGSFVPVRGSMTIKARAYMPMMYTSAVKSTNYSIKAAPVVYVSMNGSGSIQNGKSWKTAYKSVRQAINTAAQRSEVWVAAGTYAERITMKSYVSLYGGFAGTETNRWERNPHVNLSILDGSGKGTVVIIPQNIVKATVIDGFTIRNGKATNGAGIYCPASSPTITNNVITGNKASRNGGGIYCSQSTTYIGCNTIMDNTAENGGGIYCDKYTCATIANNIIARNTTKWGGGIFLSAWSGGSIIGNTIADNTSSVTGGGIYSYYSYPVIGNNIIAYCTTGVASIYPFGAPYAINNCMFENGMFDFSEVFGGVNYVGDPEFVDRAAGDYHLQPTSGCIDAGRDSSVIFPCTDVDGESRVAGMHIDIGADECAVD